MFLLVLNVFYSSQRGSNGFITEITILFSKKSDGLQHFPGDGDQLFTGGGGPNAYFYRVSYNVIFLGRGSGPPIPPLDPHMNGINDKAGRIDRPRRFLIQSNGSKGLQRTNELKMKSLPRVHI